MAALWNRADHYIFVLWFLSFFFSLPILSGRRLDVYHTFTHDVALVRIENACLKCAARGSMEIQDAKIAENSPSHNFVGLCLRNEGIYRQLEERVKQQYLLRMSPQCAERRPITG